MSNHKAIDPLDLHKLLIYDPESGFLTWRERGAEWFNGRTEGECRRWNTRYAGKPAFVSPNSKGYPNGSILDTNYTAHVVIWAMMTGRWPDHHIDHEDTDRANNRWINLKKSSPALNAKNRRMNSSNSSGVTGVYFNNKEGKWRAFISIKGKKTGLGVFSKIEDAVSARREAERIHDFHPLHGQPNRGISI